jgi:uncharacterized protein YndB with AHSA1/START domain
MMSPTSVSHDASKSSSVLVQKTVTVRAPVERAFRVFTAEMSSWWPLVTHKIGTAAMKEAVVEPFVGGRWFERGVDGSECDWGKVLAWSPPHRLVLSWEISASWKHDSSIQTEVEVRFVSEGGMTRVELEHRCLETYGERAEEMRGIFASPGGWGGMLDTYVERASAA